MTACSSSTSKVKVEVAKSEVVYLTPEKIVKPVAPRFVYLDSSKGLDDKENFKRLQINFIKMRDYCQDLVTVIEYYESSIDELKNKKEAK